jgi:hypothetical protein
MGCAASGGSGTKATPEATEKADSEVQDTTWASARTNVFSAPDAERGGEGNATASEKGGSHSVVGKHEPVLVSDADNDSDVEIIVEANPRAVASAANGQEAPEALEVLSDTEKAREKPKPALSKQQEEEAAKLAEQRKRFDNQKYHQKAAGQRQFSGSTSGTTGTNASTGDLFRDPSPDAEDTEDILLYECLPGGIPDDGDGIRKERPPQKMPRNHHDAFDGADELLMTEILDTAEA